MRVLQTLLAFSGNAPPQLAVTRKLVERGHEVRVLAHVAARERIEATGAELVPFLTTAPDLDLSRAETDLLRDWQARTWAGAGVRALRNGVFRLVGGVADECSQALAAQPADVVVFDWMLVGGAVAAEAAGLPATALVHCPYPLPVEGVPPLVSGMRPARGPAGALRDRVMRAGAACMFASALPSLNAIRAEHGLAPLKRWEGQLLGAEAIYVLSSPALDFASRGRLPANVSYVGPAFEPYPREWRSPWPDDADEPLVVISLSTSFMDQGALAQRILDAVDGLPVRALLTTGPALDAARLRVPSNVRTIAWVPHRAVFPHARLAITHAGWQTVNAALADGVPLLCVPDGRDQPGNAARVVAAGAGLEASKRCPPRRLRRLILRALEDPALLDGARAMALELGRLDGADTVADALEEIGARGGPAQPR